MEDQPTVALAVTQSTSNRTATSLSKTTAPSTPEAVVEAKVDKVVLVETEALAEPEDKVELAAVVSTTTPQIWALVDTTLQIARIMSA